MEIGTKIVLSGIVLLIAGAFIAGVAADAKAPRTERTGIALLSIGIAAIIIGILVKIWM